MSQHVKLAKGASMFFDPSLKFKVLPGQVAKLPKNYRTSKFTMDRIRNGHLNHASDVEVAEYEKNNKVDESSDESTAVDLNALSKTELMEKVLNEYEYTEAELKNKKKAELIAILTEEDDEEEEVVD